MISQRTPYPFILTIIVLTGTVIGGIITGVNPVFGLVALAAIIGLSIIVAVLVRPSLGLVVVLTTVIFIDLVRRFVAFYTGSWSVAQLLIVDVLVALTLISILLPTLVKRGRIVARSFSFGFSALFGIYIFWIIIQIFNPTVPDFLQILVGIRVYISPIFVIVIAWYALDNWKQREWSLAYKIILFYAIVVIVYGAIPLIINPNSLGGVLKAILQPAEHAVRTWEDGLIDLSSSVFASSKRFGRFLLMTFPFLWISLDTRKKHRTKLLIFLLYCVGCFISGSREALLLLIFMFLFLGKWWTAIGQFFPLVIVGGAIAILLVGPQEAQRRFEFTVSTPDDWLARIEYMTIAPVFRLLPTELNLRYLFGIGAGRAGQSYLLYGPDSSMTMNFPNSPFTSSGLSDAGLYQVFIELGLIGLCLFVAFHMYILILPWRHDSNDPYIRASGIALLIWFILFLKSHTVLSDQVTMIAFWFYVGLITTRIGQSKRSVKVLNEQVS